MAFALWHDGVGAGFDRCHLTVGAAGAELTGTVRSHAGDESTYRLTTGPGWRVVEVIVTPPTGAALELRREDDGWSVGGSPRPDLAGCEDVVLPLTPAWVTAAVRRRAHGPLGDGAIVVSASPSAVRRTTHHLDLVEPDLWRYAVGSDASLVHVGPQGLVVEWEDRWKAVAVG